MACLPAILPPHAETPAPFSNTGFMTPSTQSPPSSKRYSTSHHQESTNEYHHNHRSHSSHTPLPVRDVPPAVPSPPPLSSRYTQSRSSELPCRSAALHTLEMPSHDSQWVFPADVMLHTPSARHGLPVAEERSRRAKGVNFIIQAAMMLNLPQAIICTAAVYFHRFYMRYSLVTEKGGVHHYPIAATALFLATKAEEQCRKTKEIVICIAKVAQKNASLVIDEQSKEFWRWKDNILQFEETMLETLTFDIHIDSPYRILGGMIPMFSLEGNKTLRNLCWAFLNDSSLTHLCVLQPAKDIAIAALFFALAHEGSKIPDDEDGNPWWEQADGTPSRISQAMDVMYDLYEDNPLGKKDNPYERSPTDSNESKLERTRHRPENGNGIHSQSHSEADTPGGSAGVATPELRTEQKQTNGNGVPKEDGELTPNGKTPSEKEITREQPDGSSDYKLKEAANDPATHENTAGDSIAPVTNGTSTNHAPSPTTSPKRKAAEAGITNEAETNGASKRPRLENGASTPNGNEKSDEEGEEGELEE